jgi:hypothetical protein
MAATRRSSWSRNRPRQRSRATKAPSSAAGHLMARSPTTGVLGYGAGLRFIAPSMRRANVEVLVSEPAGTFTRSRCGHRRQEDAYRDDRDSTTAPPANNDCSPRSTARPESCEETNVTDHPALDIEQTGRRTASDSPNRDDPPDLCDAPDGDLRWCSTTRRRQRTATRRVRDFVGKRLIQVSRRQI